MQQRSGPVSEPVDSGMPSHPGALPRGGTAGTVSDKDEVCCDNGFLNEFLFLTSILTPDTQNSAGG